MPRLRLWVEFRIHLCGDAAASVDGRAWGLDIGGQLEGVRQMFSDISILTLQPADPGRAVQTPDRAQSARVGQDRQVLARDLHPGDIVRQCDWSLHVRGVEVGPARSEEHTSELQSRENLVCRLL